MDNLLIDKFLKYLGAVKSCSACTLDAYGKDLILFFKFIKSYLELDIEISEINVFILKSIKPDTIYSYLIYLNCYRNNTASSRQRRLGSLRSFYKYLYRYYPIKGEANNVMTYINRVQQIYRLPKYFTKDQAKQLLHVFNEKNCKYHERNNAIINVFLNTGVRLSELVSLNRNSIDFENKLCKLVGKGGDERIIYFNDMTLERLNIYLKTRNDTNEALFISNKIKRISKDTVEDICKKAYKLIGISDFSNYSAHALRHTAANLMYSKTKDILLTKKFLRT